MIKVSNSRLNLWRRCHYAHYLKYTKGLVKKVKAAALQRGSIIHKCIEEYNEGRSWKKCFKEFEKGFYANTMEEERVELGDIPGMVKELLENYFFLYEDEELEYLENELHFELPLNSEITLEGYIDAVAQDPNEKVWAKEIKTYARTPDRDFLIFNAQSAIYTWALQELGYKSEGMMWDIIKAKCPSKPKMTQKTNKLSIAKLDSTPYTVRKGIKELGLDVLDYKDFIDSHDFDSYFIRHFIRLNKNVVKQIMGDTLSTATEILNWGNSCKDRNLSKDCGWCSYKSICQAELMGLDVDYIIKAEYELREEKENGVRR